MAGEFNRLIQIGMVVSDLDGTLENFQKILGVGPFKVVSYPPADMGEVELAQRICKGKVSDFTAKFCFFDFGNIEFEIIQPLGGENIWTDFLREKGPGLHHLKFLVDRLEPVQEHLSQFGIKTVQKGPAVGKNKGKEWAYYDATEQMGICIELMNDMIV